MTEKSRWQELEATGHTVSEKKKKQRKSKTSAHGIGPATFRVGLPTSVNLTYEQ